LYYVATPDPVSTTTSFQLWDGSSTSTYATSYRTVTGEDGKETIDLTYYVETPSHVSTTTIPWTGSEVTTSTSYITTTGTDGVAT
ncbi:hypothetical protein HANVADRAFT_12062, partial [Hanseniaspora valbyensis NRRL Y-1626]